MCGADQSEGAEVEVDDRLRAVAAKSPNSGYLLVHEPVLVAYGATA
jgi:hypothetical protein